MIQISRGFTKLASLAILACTAGCDGDSSSAGGGVVGLQKIECATPQDCLDELKAYDPGSSSQASDFVCVRPTPTATQGHCDHAQTMVACPDNGCGCQACVKRLDLLCSGCTASSACLPATYCNGLSASDCDPPTIGNDVCNPAQVID